MFTVKLLPALLTAWSAPAGPTSQALASTRLSLSLLDSPISPTAKNKDTGASKSKRKALTKKHGIGLVSGISMLPKGYLKGRLAAYTLPRCRSGGPSDKEKDGGLIRAENCSWFAGLQYIYRRSEHLDLAATAEYRKFKFPDGLWIKREDWGSECKEDDGEDCDLGMADFVEVDFSHVYLGGEAIGYATLVKKPRWLVQIGGGGGFGLVLFTGNRLMQTPIGRGSNGRPGSESGSTCDTLQDLGDFTKCQPQWWDDPDIDQDGDGDKDNDELEHKKLKKQDGFVDCNENSCDYEDLQALGSRRRTFGPRVLALPKVVASARVLFDQSYGLNIHGGFNGGLFMGASLQYFFGKQK